jgi:hypothetical protein
MSGRSAARETHLGAPRWEAGSGDRRDAVELPSASRPPGRVRWPGLALVTAALSLLAGLLLQVAEATVGAIADVAASGPARLEDVVGGVAGLAVFALLLWGAVAVFASIAAALLPRAGGRTSSLSRAVAPAVLRRLVAALLGVAVVGCSAPARADTGGPETVAVVCAPTPRRVAAATSPPVAVPDPLSAAWHPTDPVVSPGWVPTEALARRPSRPGVDPGVVTAPRRRLNATVDDEVVVRRGDTLWSLTERYLGPGATGAQVNREWPRWVAANRSVLTRGPDHLVPGMRLRPPGSLPPTGTDPVPVRGREAWR